MNPGLVADDDAAIAVANFEKAKAAGDLQGMSLWKAWEAFALYEAGRDSLPAKREALRLELEGLRAAGISSVEITTDDFPPFSRPGACKDCKKLAGTKMSIARALALMPLPHATCTRDMGKSASLCRCGFLPA